MINTDNYEKLILFAGQNLDKWQKSDGSPADWELKEGIMTVTNGSIYTKEEFADAFIHVEFKLPHMPDKKGQAKGNSGVFLQNRYEIQVLDSSGIEIPGTGDCGSIYNMYAPLVNACKPAEQWQNYDIIFRAPRFNKEGELLEKPRVTVFQNDILIHNNVEISSPTVAPGPIESTPGPLMLQDHNDPVSFRNIWMVHLPPKGSETYEPR